MSIRTIFPASVLWWISTVVSANELTPAQQEQWLNSKTPAEESQKISGRALSFLSATKHMKVMHSENRIMVSESSLTDGWVSLSQCYHQLDAFPRVEVVYQYRQMRKLQVVSQKGISKAQVEGQSVQLEHVSKNASLCIRAEVQILTKEKNGYYLKNGPFRKKFLDGYFPMRVTVHIDYPPKLLSVNSTEPQAQMHFVVKQKPGSITLHGIFEGELNTQVVFSRAQ